MSIADAYGLLSPMQVCNSSLLRSSTVIGAFKVNELIVLEN